MTLAVSTVADSISKLSVTGVTIKDLNEIPTEVLKRDCPTVYPKPDGFLSNFEPESVSMSSGTSVQLNVTYTLTYRFLHSPLGSDRGLFGVYQDMVNKTTAFLDKIIISDTITGLVDLQIADVSEFGPVSDPAGNMFHGCDISLDVLEFVN